jgi:hypothetical protein
MHYSTCATKPEAGRTERPNKIAVVFAATLLLAGCSAPKTPGGGGGSPGGGSGAHKPLKPGPDQKVLLHWKQGAWWVQLNGGNDEDPNKATLKLAKDIGPTMFEVTIQGKPGATFKPAGLTVWETSKSGTSGSTQILGPFVCSDGKKLTFYDLNQGDPVKIYYSLNLTDGASIDPIIDNGGSS